VADFNRDEIAKKWMGRLIRLNPASGRGLCLGKAPHKPLFHLSLLDLAESGELVNRVFTRSPGLALRFRNYGALVVERWPSRLDLRLPFFHLRTQGFWESFDVEMNPAGSPETCAVGEMNSEFFDLIGDPGFRWKARMVLISKYFEPVEQTALFESMGIQVGGEAKPRHALVMEEAENAAKRKGRSARFAVRVCSEYRFTCALTGYRCVSITGSSIVDAAHIEPWSLTQNDDPENGLALSKNAHWMFDAGLWTVDDDLRILVNAKTFSDHGPESLRLAAFAGRHLQFDPAAKLRPALESLRRHRRGVASLLR